MLTLDRLLEARWDSLVKQHYSSLQNQPNSKKSSPNKSPDASPISVGFLIGNRNSKDESTFCVEFSTCPLPESVQEDRIKNEKGTGDNKVKTVPTDCIDEDWLNMHSRQVVRMLPGGLDIIGLYLIADKPTVRLLNPMLIRTLKTIAVSDAEMSCRSRLSSPVAMYLITQDSPLGTFHTNNLHQINTVR